VKVAISVLNNVEVQPHCIICGCQKEKEDGIYIVSEFICKSCEMEMVQTDVKDDKYPYFINRMKQILIKKNA